MADGVVIRMERESDLLMGLEDGGSTFVEGTYVHRFGTGSRIFFGIHGWGGSHLTFEPIAAHMPEDATIFAIDMPGYGRSESPASWTPTEVQTRLVSVLRHVPEDVTLLGNCSGAVFGLLAALQAPNAFRRFVLVDPFAYFPWYFVIFTWPLIGRILYAVSFQNPIGRILTNLSLASKRTDETDLTGSFGTVNHDAVFQTLQVMKAIGGFQTFEPISGEIEVLYGARTFGAVRNSISMWRSIWPESKTHELAGAGHLPLQEATLEFVDRAFADTRAIAPEVKNTLPRSRSNSA